MNFPYGMLINMLGKRFVDEAPVRSMSTTTTSPARSANSRRASVYVVFDKRSTTCRTGSAASARISLLIQADTLKRWPKPASCRWTHS